MRARLLRPWLAAVVIGAAGTLFSMGATTNVASAEPPPTTHGFLVRTAAHTCPRGPGGVHGRCVSTVARTNAPTPPVEPPPVEPPDVPEVPGT